MLESFLNSDFGRAPTDFRALILGLLISLAGGHILAWVYMITHSGLSYSRSFVKSLIVMPVVVALVMHVLSNNLITAFGMMAVFTIVRFRNMLRDTLDTTYILLVLALGMAAGSEKFATAVAGLLVMVLALLYLWLTSFGSRHRYDVILNLHWSRSLGDLPEVERLLERHARRSRRASQRSSSDAGAGADISYWLLLRDPERVGELLSELQSLTGVSRISSMMAEDESEV
jgi:hypothetical protein